MKKAFTLIELIATIVILGVVTSIVSILIMNVIRNVKDSARKRSIDNYGRIIETSMAEYQSQYLKYPDSIDQLEIEYVGSVIECETRRINPDKTIYLSECKVNGKKVLDKSTEDGYYHYGTLVLTNEEYVDKLGKNIEVALKDYYEENNKYPVNYRLLNLPKLDKDVNCVSKIYHDGTVYLTKCSIDGSYILNENEEDGYYHYGIKYDYKDKDGNGYNEVKYLESTGTQYIDTGLRSTVNTQILTKISWTNITKRQLFGADGGLYFGVNERYWELASNNTAMEARPNTWYNIDYKLTPNSTNYTNTLVVDENTFTYDRSFTGDNKIYLFTVGNSSGPSTSVNSSCKLGATTIKQNDIVVRDYVPVIDSSNIFCMYDKIENKCYYNQGNGIFYGYTNSYIELNYIESTGTQYIDTGLRSTVNTQILTKISWTNITKRQLFGADGGLYFGVNNRYWELASNNTAMEARPNTWYNIDYKLTSNSTNYTNTLVVDENTFTYDRSFTGDNKIYLLTVGNSSGPSTSVNSSCKLGATTIKQNDIVVRDYVPILDSYGRPCLFDKVSNEFYYNQGTGEFLYG